jgi:hypothetical protein
MICQPMDASGFRTLASYFPDFTVITYDPRGLGRSTRNDGRVDNVPTSYRPDFDALAAAPTRIVTAVGEESRGTFTGRTSLATAGRAKRLRSVRTICDRGRVNVSEQTPPWPKQGPASHFPSIEKKYGRSIREWQDIIAGCGHPCSSRCTMHRSSLMLRVGGSDQGGSAPQTHPVPGCACPSGLTAAPQ